MKINQYRLKDFFYLLSLYFKRGTKLNVFYSIMLILGLTLSGILLEANSKIKALIQEVDKKLPPNRVKLVVPANIRNTPTQGLLTNLFSLKAKNVKHSSSLKYKDYITVTMIKQIEQMKEVAHIVPLYSIDFPMGMVIAIPGSNTPIQTQMIGSGMSSRDAKPFLSPLSSYKDFKIVDGKPVPVLLSRFLIPILNTLAQNNGLNHFHVEEKDLIGIKLKVFVGRSQLSSSLAELANGDQKEIPHIDNASFSDVKECIIAGFTDLDYTMGLAFPQDFLFPYKKAYWGNFTDQTYDSVVIDLPIQNGSQIKQSLEGMGFQFAGDAGILNKLTSLLQKQQEGFGLFLTFISVIVIAFVSIILFYTLIWLLRGKSLEFMIYQFFGASQKKLITLYMVYLTFLNIVGFVIASIIVHIIFYGLKVVVIPLKSKIPVEFQDIFQAPFLNQLLIFPTFWICSFLLLEVVSILFIKEYLRRLNNSM